MQKQRRSDGNEEDMEDIKEAFPSEMYRSVLKVDSSRQMDASGEHPIINFIFLFPPSH